MEVRSRADPTADTHTLAHILDIRVRTVVSLLTPKTDASRRLLGTPARRTSHLERQAEQIRNVAAFGAYLRLDC